MVQKEKKIWTVLDLLEWTTGFLSQKSFANPRLNVEWLLGDTLGYKRVELYMNADRPLSTNELSAFKEKLNRRLQHEPLQYIVGATEFMGLAFNVSPDVLIPRPDTEILVEKTLEICKLFSDSIHMLDIGTGSGAIAVSLAYFLKRKRGDFSITAIDQSEAALRVAKMNAEKNGMLSLIDFRLCDIMENIDSLGHSFDVIVSNPPYISANEFDLLPEEIRNFEPEKALRGGDDGLAFYRRIAAIAGKLFKTSGQRRFLVLEIGYDQAEAVKKILIENYFHEVDIINDFENHPRVVIATM